MLRDRLFATLESAEEIEEGGFELDGTRLGQGEVEGWLKKHARVADARVGVQVQGTWRAGTGDVYALALATGDGSAAWLDAEQLTPEDDRALADWLADPSYRKVLHDAKGRCWRCRPGAGASRAWSGTPRCRRTSPDPTSAPTTSPTSPCATSSASCARRTPTRAS